MKESTKRKFEAYAPWIFAGASIVLLSVVLSKSKSDISRIISEAASDNAKSLVADNSVDIFDGFVSNELSDPIASLVLDANFDPYNNIGKQLYFSNGIGENFAVEIIQAG